MKKLLPLLLLVPSLVAAQSPEPINTGSRIGTGTSAQVASTTATEQYAGDLGVVLKPATALQPPKWPDSDARQCRTGEAVVKFAVAIDGTIAEVVVLSSPTQAIAKSVATTISHWRFEPFSRPDGSVDPVWLKIPVKFDGEWCHR
jgi:TonB family protein